MSLVAWLDYSDKQRREALSVIDAFREKETVDELGIGRIRDAFGERLFPGTSTIQTRARYFLFVAWTYAELERRRAPASDVGKRGRREEIDLIEELVKSGEREGVIGIQAKASLQRLPSSVYWQGLHTLGIRLFPDGQAQYHRSFGRSAANSTEDIAQEASESMARARGSWDPHLPSRPKGFPVGATLRLERGEAEYLRDRITQAAPRSYFAFLVTEGGASEVALPWAHPRAKLVPERVAHEIEHARSFAEAIWSAPLLYNLMLAEKIENAELVEQYRQALERWRGYVVERRAELDAWSRAREAFWELAGSVPFPTHRFITTWLDLVLPTKGQDLMLRPGALAESAEARLLVRDRERQLKGKLARLENPTALRMWRGDSGTALLSYRWHRVQRMVADIHDGLAREEGNGA